MSVKFEIPYFTVSGVTVRRVSSLISSLTTVSFYLILFTLSLSERYLKIVEKSGYQALPWVRYITQNGDYQLRMARFRCLFA